MRRNIAICTLLTALLLANTTVDVPGQTTRDWSNLRGIASSAVLEIETKDGRKIKGTLVTFSDTQISVSGKGAVADLPRDSVRRVYRLGGKSRKNGAALGAAIGGGAGIGAGVGVFAQGDFVWGVVPIFGLIGAGIGAAIGAAVGRGKSKTIIYEAP